MEPEMRYPVDFLKALIFFPKGSLPQKLFLPRGFVDRFGGLLPEIVNIKTMDEQRFSIKFSAEDGCFFDMHALLSKLLPKECQFFYFKYLGGPNFEVFLLDVKYDLHGISGIASPFQCMFIRIYPNLSSKWEPLRLSEEFISKYGSQIPREIRFQVSDGSFLGGIYDKGDGTITGLQPVYKFYNLSFFEPLVFTYLGVDLFVVNAFGKDCMPKNVNSDSGDFFEVELKPSHLLEYDFGVTIPAKFKSLLSKIDCNGFIKIKHGNDSWNVLLKKRPNRVELHTGWTLLWKSLRLLPGDICVFRRAGSNFKFNCEVYRHHV
ncbi:hypothetical protein DCAR_0831927 [Daucus carota subsp. sativus]|uniref:TF-B3 domain-containing protein n=1 Tax=Daucus carota subsp. sativus TaxID=79200 RepID=A0A175YPD7_DAUCS|nr:hypothetical protein DCAR_0831927 [Daucus carota subsp. sativus]